MTARANILFVDDEPEILASLRRVVRNMDLNVQTAESGEQALQLMESGDIDVLVTDKNMPGMSGNELLAVVAERWPDVITIMLTAYNDLDELIEVVNKGRLWSYLQKPLSNAALKITIENALQTRDLMSERSLLRRTLDKVNNKRKRSFQRFIGESTSMQLVYNALTQCVPSQASVFITGESGTGKELAAEALHTLSSRSEKPFICLNCAAIPTELMESEIFGHVKGAFSGAVANRDGAATAADGGTLFLDEIGEMDISLQSKILRFIQTGTFQRVGSSKTEKVDIRFVCATNRDPMEAIAENLLREDLYYRLAVISIDMPPLRERENDPLLIAQYFLGKYSDLEEKVFVGLSDAAQTLLTRYHWPGNVRQLQNTIHSAVVMSEGPLLTETTLAQMLKITPEQMVSLLSGSAPTRLRVDDNNLNRDSSHQSLQAPLTANHVIRPLAEVEKIAIEHAISVCEDSVVKAAGLLEVSPSTLYRKIQQWEASQGE